jgi:hypothetical protein
VANLNEQVLTKEGENILSQHSLYDELIGIGIGEDGEECGREEEGEGGGERRGEEMGNREKEEKREEEEVEEDDDDIFSQSCLSLTQRSKGMIYRERVEERDDKEKERDGGIEGENVRSQLRSQSNSSQQLNRGEREERGEMNSQRKGKDREEERGELSLEEYQTLRSQVRSQSNLSQKVRTERGEREVRGEKAKGEKEERSERILNTRDRFVEEEGEDGEGEREVRRSISIKEKVKTQELMKSLSQTCLEASSQVNFSNAYA